VLTLHIYFRVESVAELIEQTDQLQHDYGLDKPIWVNETNASPNLDPWWPVVRPSFPVDLDQQAWYIGQAVALAFGAGAESLGVYKLIDILLPEGGESFGILRPDYSKRPAYLAYQTAIRQLRDFEQPVEMQEHSAYWVVSFRRPQGITRVLWARQAAEVQVSLPALSDSAVLVDYLGQSRTIVPEGGAYRIALAGARCLEACDIGGPPVYVVEAAVDSAEPIPWPDAELPEVAATPVLSTVTPAPEITLTFTPWPTDTSTPTPTHTPSPTPTQTPSPAPTFTATPSPTATHTPTPSDIPPLNPLAQPTPEGQPSFAIDLRGAIPWLGLGGVLLVIIGVVSLTRRRAPL
jgi:hypothetical protein